MKTSVYYLTISRWMEDGREGLKLRPEDEIKE
jgi:hypothetical protein